MVRCSPLSTSSVLSSLAPKPTVWVKHLPDMSCQRNLPGVSPERKPACLSLVLEDEPDVCVYLGGSGETPAHEQDSSGQVPRFQATATSSLSPQEGSQEGHISDGPVGRQNQFEIHLRSNLGAALGSSHPRIWVEAQRENT